MLSILLLYMKHINRKLKKMNVNQVELYISSYIHYWEIRLHTWAVEIEIETLAEELVLELQGVVSLIKALNLNGMIVAHLQNHSPKLQSLAVNWKKLQPHPVHMDLQFVRWRPIVCGLCLFTWNIKKSESKIIFNFEFRLFLGI